MAAIPFLTKLKPSATRESGASEYNPYLAARREWDERYGDQITRARNWRTMALLCSLTSLVACGGMIWLSVHSRVVPFIAVVDGLGRPIASGTGDQTTTADERLKKPFFCSGWNSFALSRRTVSLNARRLTAYTATSRTTAPRCPSFRIITEQISRSFVHRRRP